MLVAALLRARGFRVACHRKIESLLGVVVGVGVGLECQIDRDNGQKRGKDAFGISGFSPGLQTN